MSIRDIVNREQTSITRCEAEPIHIPGSIQPHGFLLAVDRHDGIVRYCSGNVPAFLNRTVEQVVGQPLNSLLLPESIAELQIETGDRESMMALRFEAGNFCSLVHRYPDRILIEAEPDNASMHHPSGLYQQTRDFVQLLESARNLQELCARLAEQTRSLTGYDRVMIYRFDRNYNGEVFAESKRSDLEPFLGLHYPYTDIPAQARMLYLRNHLRIIPDVHYEPVPILTREEASAASLDLSDVQLRSVSPIHIQYLKNLGVRATLTISLIQDGRLWGLIACHHYAPKYLDPGERRLALMQGYFLSSQIRVRQVAEEHELTVTVEAHLQQLLHKIDADEDFALKFEQFTSLVPMVNATGCVVLHQGAYFEKGLVPPREKTAELIRWISEHIRALQYSTSQLSARFPPAESISRAAAGILYHALGKPTEDCIIWFREEVERTVNWAGDPNDAVRKEAGELTPRRSFALWKEQVRFQSLDWRVPEINAASRFANTLQHHFHLKYLQLEEYKLRLLNEQLQKANQELSNINWITSHDLKEPLRKIQVFASKILHQEDLSETINGSILRIQNSARRMQHLVEDILTYSLSGRKEEHFAPTDLQAILKELREELSDELHERGASLEIGELPSDLRAIPYQIHQLFSNLISNSLKFQHAGAQPVMRVDCQRVYADGTSQMQLSAGRPYYRISVSDNGIGFDPRHEQRIFDIFFRLHQREEYGGTGIGLAICKKIMDNHGGVIEARGEPGKGATFLLYFPIS